MDEQKQPHQTAESEPERPEETIEDLEPAEEEGEAIKGGSQGVSTKNAEPVVV